MKNEKMKKNIKYKCFIMGTAGLFRRGVRSQAHAPTHVQKCLDV